MAPGLSLTFSVLSYLPCELTTLIFQIKLTTRNHQCSSLYLCSPTVSMKHPFPACAMPRVLLISGAESFIVVRFCVFKQSSNKVLARHIAYP